jgi:membrane-bound lytic murein transglycosylase D
VGWCKFIRQPWLWLGLGLLGLLSASQVLAAEDPVPRPTQLEPDVQFWVKVYSQIDTNSGFLHDQNNLGVIYETLHFPPDATPAERERLVDAARDRIGAALRRIADAQQNGAALAEEDQRIKALWGAQGTPERLRMAVDDIRFQLGQSDRFRAGLIRAGAWQTHIAETLANLGLPAELAVLPHVESSFNPSAYSKVGAAGLWQFMRSTGRRYMRIDGAVDDRLDPFRSTEAAAQLLAYNYRALGTWPLALTAYNHGTEGMRRALETMGTSDIVSIVRGYHSRTFGFASRNFYVSFLAALEIDRDPAKYFGALPKEPEAEFQEVRLPAYVSMSALLHVLKAEPTQLRVLNPALLPAVWDGRQRVPRDYRLRLPLDGSHWTSELLATRLGPQELFAGQRAPPRYRVQKGDTLASVADRYGVSIQALAQMNRLRTSAHLSPGRTLTVPESPPEPVAAVTALVAANEHHGAAAAAPESAAAATSGKPGTAGAPPRSTPPPPARATPSPGGAVSEETAQRESAEDAAAATMAEIVVHGHVRGAQPVSAAQADALGPALGPAGDAQQNPDPTDYSVDKDGFIRIAPDETLGHFADWLAVPTSDLRALNHLKSSSQVLIGERLKLAFRKVPRDEFEQRRRAYHQALQASYFASHRILGTEIHIARPGDSLWTLTQHGAQLPVWLLQQYNPDVDLTQLHAGVQLVVPHVEEIESGG